MTNYRAPVAYLLAVMLWALAPPIVHLTALNANPFHFNLTVIAIEAGLLLLFLYFSASAFFRRPLAKIAGESASGTLTLKKPGTYISYFAGARRGKPGVSLDALNKDVSKVGLKRLILLIRLPLIWSIIGTLHYGFFAWSTQYVETAIATTIYETWPFFLILFMTRHNSIDEAYRLGQSLNVKRRSGVGVGEVLVLSISAVIGVTLISVSQYGTVTFDSMSWNNARGLLLATMASVLNALWVSGSLILGKTIYYTLVQPVSDQADDSAPWSVLPVNERPREHRRLLLWLTVAGIVVARLGTLPALLLFGRIFFDFDSLSLGLSLTTVGLVGGIVLGVVSALSATLRRYGDISATGPGVHALAFLTPPLSLLLLWKLGFELPRLDIFVIGAALIIATNILIQARPDQHRNLSAFGIENVSTRGRLGFNAFILSLWTFGTVIYMRDDITSTALLEWKSGEYWGLLALSATVFALILGFRIVRLAARIDQEDEITVRLFRDCEHLVRRKQLTADVIEDVQLLDMTRTRQLVDAYTSLRAKVVFRMDRITLPDDYQVLRDVETNLDRLCHLKQQGRDIVELISLSAFALVTICIGLLSRPAELSVGSAAWSGFMSESFVLVFVSTVAFLWVNLFDMRRDRSIPTLVPVPEYGGDYGVFFRYDRDLRVKHISAILLSTAMAATFVLLLHDKWLR